MVKAESSVGFPNPIGALHTSVTKIGFNCTWTTKLQQNRATLLDCIPTLLLPAELE